MTVVALALVAGIGAVDASTPSAVRLGTVYILPVLAAQAWGVRWAGTATAVAGVISDATVSWLLGVHEVYVLAILGTVRLAVFLLCAQLVRLLQHDRGRLQRLALADELTGLFNRRGFGQLAHREIQRSARYGHPVGLLYLDVDDLKTVNDRHGHEAGDAVLVAVASSLKGAVRGHDVVARIGGDEFAILLPETDEQGVAVVAAHIADRVTKLRPPPPAPADRPIGLSVGYAVRDDRTPDLKRLMQVADANMYRNKARRRPIR